MVARAIPVALGNGSTTSNCYVLLGVRERREMKRRE